MTLKNPFVLLTLLSVAVGGYLLFWESDEAYLKKTTLQLLKSAEGPFTRQNPVAFLGRVNKIAKHFHFDVAFQLETGGQVRKGRTAEELRTLLLIYFKQGGVEEITAEDLTVQKKAESSDYLVRFTARGRRGKARVSCKVSLLWIKEKKWFIKEAEVFSCSPEFFQGSFLKKRG